MLAIVLYLRIPIDLAIPVIITFLETLVPRLRAAVLRLALCVCVFVRRSRPYPRHGDARPARNEAARLPVTAGVGQMPEHRDSSCIRFE